MEARNNKEFNFTLHWRLAKQNHDYTMRLGQLCDSMKNVCKYILVSATWLNIFQIFTKFYGEITMLQLINFKYEKPKIN